MTAAHDTQALAAMTACGECGMPCRPTDYHPMAACLMFKACHDSAQVTANLQAVREHARASRLQEQEGQPALSEREEFEAWAHSEGWSLTNLSRSVVNDTYSWRALNEAWKVWQARATLAAGSQAVQVPGWKLVPVEPTKEMIDAGAMHTMRADEEEPYRAHGEAIAAYSDMLNAAPLQPLAGGEVGK